MLAVELEPFDLRVVARQILAVADHDSGDVLVEFLPCRLHRVDEHVGTLQVAHHADVEKVGGIGLSRYRFEFRVAQAVIDQAVGHARLTDLADEGAAFVVGDEQQMIGETLHQAFEPEEQLSGHRPFVIVQSAAMRRIEAGHAIP
jgi:hypothetical protein